MMLAGQDPKALEAQMLQNPQFRQFVDENRNRSIDEICYKYNINANDFKNSLH